MNSVRSQLSSINYRFLRRLIIMQQSLLKKDLEGAIIVGDKINHLLMNSPFKHLFKFSIPNNIGTYLYNLNFPSPIIAASFKDDISALLQWQFVGIGGITYKTVLKNPSEGNKRPRIQEVSYNGSYALLNSLGLPTKGVDNFVNHFEHEQLLSFNRPIGISIGGDSVADYVQVFESINSKVESSPFDQFFYEINISCPNTEDGKCLSDDLNQLAFLLTKMRSLSSKVIVVKTSPDSNDNEILKICEILSSLGKSAINVGNTRYVSVESVGLKPNHFSKPGGGLSGPPLFDSTLERVKLINSNFKIPIIATGGIGNYDQVKAIIDNGARLIGMASRLVIDPFIIPQINNKLSHEEILIYQRHES